MRRGIVHYVALITLLVQGVLGSVAPAAVLCLHSGSCESSRLIDEVSTSCGVQRCCQPHLQEEHAATRPAIAIALPCDDDCQSCVDIALPDLDLASVDRVDVQAEDLSPHSLSAMMVDVDFDLVVPRLLPRATGPPDHLACLHAPIIRSTRLLI